MNPGPSTSEPEQNPESNGIVGDEDGLEEVGSVSGETQGGAIGYIFDTSGNGWRLA